MKKDLAGITILPAAFEELAGDCKFDPKFPPSFPAWLALEAEGAEEARAAGRTILRVDLEPARFRRWCQIVGIVPGLEALRAYAIVERQQSQPLARGLRA
ncbi:hypothetical protein OOT46_02330 [Aquabacterium sp. A7-Y]|uniref:hypothetical protein n=1 Tax=Aquabacterium sp. A7-Y TaxID=1349605 RepID=UPI00223DF287|nr:hypothetical protein [Aquabacterium sp. A7-Y]MCW7536692.1 hypothetical protein [Aquabacterium sp. A7-Y]